MLLPAIWDFRLRWNGPIELFFIPHIASELLIRCISRKIAENMPESVLSAGSIIHRVVADYRDPKQSLSHLC